LRRGGGTPPLRRGNHAKLLHHAELVVVLAFADRLAVANGDDVHDLDGDGLPFSGPDNRQDGLPHFNDRTPEEGRRRSDRTFEVGC
jgi:hypothetical protein